MKLENNEIYKTLGWRRTFHELVMKPIGYHLSSKILRGELLKAIGEVRGKRIIDVSCGDDYFPIILAKMGAIVTCNDICFDAMRPLLKYGCYVAFTNKNLMEVNHERKFDVVLFKNTFHHLKNVTQIRKTLKSLKNLGRKIIIMDIDDPTKDFLGKVWNTYYRKVLKDQGDMFIGYDSFKFHINEIFKRHKVEFKRIRTIKGWYMLAIIN